MFRWLILVPVALGSACAIPPASPPRAEFLVATADSAFWVITDAGGVHIRGVPMTLARYDGTFSEVYVSDLDRSFTDAVFTGERLYVRNLVTGDSLLVYEDTAIIHLAELYARTIPGAQPLGSHDQAPDDPTVAATGETDILDVRGPYVLIEHRSNVGHGEVAERYDTTNVTVDLRTGRAVSLDKMVEDSAYSDTTAVVTTQRRWHRAGYDLLAHSDSVQGTVSFLLRDDLRHSWPLMTTAGVPRVYWLDTPPLKAKVRWALRRAFNSAAVYDETIKYVRYVTPKQEQLFHSVSLSHSL